MFIMPTNYRNILAAAKVNYNVAICDYQSLLCMQVGVSLGLYFLGVLKHLKNLNKDRAGSDPALEQPASQETDTRRFAISERAT